MNAEDLYAQLRQGTSTGWHWWAWHFQALTPGRAVPFAAALVDALLEVDVAMPGYAERTVEAISALAGREKDRADYEQLLQRLTEIHVALHTIRAEWPQGSSFADEPVAAGSARNPEMVVTTPELRLGIEVKAPALLKHEEWRSTRPWQASGRGMTKEHLNAIAGGAENLTPPRDNPVKDFLVSADAKFAAFATADPGFYGVLAIVWDDFIYEPISALLHPSSGLLTDDSFARDEQGQRLRFPNVDAIVLISHLQYFKLALAENGEDRPFAMSDRVFDWHPDPARPPVVIGGPDGRALPAGTAQLLDVRPLETIVGAEYNSSDLVMWIDPTSEER